MWLLTRVGFFSVVQHDDDKSQLQVRARVKSDLDNLRKLVPTLGPTVELGSRRDYPFRAYISKSDFAEGAKVLAENIDYDNFKDTVAKEQGYDRSHVYGKVWGILHGMTAAFSERPKPSPRPGVRIR